jgi:uncharacterized protein YeaO (DUF488 family)
MKIYTSYFAALRRIPEDVIPISICLKSPYWFKGIKYKTLAPSNDIFSQQKANPNENLYTARFYNEILGGLDRGRVVKELENLCGGNDVVLLCYEKSSSFCHRHLVAGWLNELPGSNVTEWV